jgi:nicotinate-nucleotide adenylyltransferase
MQMTGSSADDGFALKDCGRRIGLLGGTFDPVHNGHLALAGYVLNSLRLDSILFIPAAYPPHKGQGAVTSFAHRVAMLKVALRPEPRFSLADLEARRSGPSYSVDTLRELRRQLAPAVRLFFIIGMDAFVELSTWKDHRQLLDYADLAVVPRPDYPLNLIGPVVGRLGRYFFDAAGFCWRAADRSGLIHPVNMVPVRISSTAVREKTGAGASLDGLVPAGVAEYITAHRLYAAP